MASGAAGQQFGIGCFGGGSTVQLLSSCLQNLRLRRERPTRRAIGTSASCKNAPANEFLRLSAPFLSKKSSLDKLKPVDAAIDRICWDILSTAKWHRSRRFLSVSCGSTSFRFKFDMDSVFSVPRRGFQKRVSVISGRKSLANSGTSEREEKWVEKLWRLSTQKPDIAEISQKQSLQKFMGGQFLKDEPREAQAKIAQSFTDGFVQGYEKAKAPPKPSFVPSLYRIAMICFFVWLGYSLLFRRASGGISGIILGSNQEVDPEEVTVTFADVKGIQEAKVEVMEIVEYLREPEKFSRLGGRLPKGILLVGPPGTGKTLLARAIAGEADVPFFHASGSEFDEVLVGQGAKRVRDLFANAKKKAPAVVFIDEIDSVGAKRVSTAIHPYANQTINQLLAEMDGFHQNEGVIIIGATNRKDDLDKALLRPGRFDVIVNVNIPDLKDRTEIFELYLGKVQCAADVNAEQEARRSTGFSGADIESMVNQAAIRAAADGLPEVTAQYLENARDKVSMGPERKDRVLSKEVIRNTAFHEAGHALVAFYTKQSKPTGKVTIVPRGQSLGHTQFEMPEQRLVQMSKAELMADIDVAMGGRVAEELIFGGENVTTGAANDFKIATTLAKAMVTAFGMSEKVGQRFFEEPERMLLGEPGEHISEATSEIVDAEIKRILQESYQRATDILKSHSKEHRRLAEALIEHETLDAVQMKRVIQGESLLTS